MIQVISRNMPFHKRCLWGFEKEMARLGSAKYEITEVGASDDVFVTRAVIQACSEQKPTAFVTLGEICTQAAAAALAQTEIPQFFCGAKQLDFMQKIDPVNNGRLIAGVNMGQPLHIAAAHVARFLKPHMKHIVIPYCVASDDAELLDEIACIREYLEKHDIKVTTIQLSGPSKALQQVATALVGADTLLCLENNAQYLDVAAVAKLCNEKRIAFFSGDRQTVLVGAAAGFVADPALAGAALARLVHMVSEGKEPLLVDERLQILGCNSRVVMMNKEACSKQGVILDDPLLYIQKHGELIGFISLDGYGIIAGYPVPELEEIYV